MSGDGGQNLIPTYEKIFSSAVVLDNAINRIDELPAESRIDFEGVPRKNWKKVLRDNLSAQAARRTTIIGLTYRSKSPAAATAVVRAIMDSYLDFMDKNHRNASVQVAEILKRELDKKEGELAAKQELQRALRRKARFVIHDGTGYMHPIVERAIKLNETLIEVRKKRLQYDGSLVAVRAAVRHGSDLRHHLISVEPVVGRELIMSALGLDPQFSQTSASVEQKLMLDRAKLDSLRGHYGPTHPQILEIQQKIANAEQYLAQIRGKINRRLEEVQGRQLGPMLIAMVEERLAEAWANERQLEKQYTLAEAEAIQLNDQVAELQIVENHIQRLLSWQDTLLDQLASTDLLKDVGEIRVTIVDEPLALNGPISPRLSVIAFLSLIGGVGIGGAIVYLLDLLDDRFRSPEELQEQVGVPVLAMVRQLPVATAEAPLHVQSAPNSVEAEAFRTLRTTLAFSADDRQRIAITSSEPGDGKTTVLANLGASIAQGGKRTLLIDADLRSPGLSKLFQIRRSEGLSNILKSNEDVDVVCRGMVQTSMVDNLDVLPCGPRPADPAEALSSSRFSDIIAWAETHYDQVLIDCPPVLAASDAAIVGRLVDGVILVVQPEKNHRRLVIRAAEHLTALGVDTIGIVVNRVSEETGSYDGYGYGYGYGLSYGYGDDDDDDRDEQVASDDSTSVVVPRRAA
jgi:capsular exopolysaccharide synthesis family protein